MLASSQQHPIGLPAHLATDGSRAATDGENGAGDGHGLALGCRPQVRHTERARDAEEEPEGWVSPIGWPGQREEGKGRAKVKQRRCRTAVKVPKCVAVAGLGGEEEGGGWVAVAVPRRGWS